MTHAIRPVDFDNLKTMTYEVTDRVARITFNRPEKGNAIIADTPLELSALVERADLDPDVHVILVSGRGEGFCAGFDLSAYAEGSSSAGGGSPYADTVLSGKTQAIDHLPDQPWDPMIDYQMMSRFVRGFSSLMHCDKPTVVKIHGYCVAGGTDIALHADQVIAASDAKIGYPPMRVWGVPAAGCGRTASATSARNAFCSRVIASAGAGGGVGIGGRGARSRRPRRAHRTPCRAHRRDAGQSAHHGEAGDQHRAFAAGRRHQSNGQYRLRRRRPAHPRRPCVRRRSTRARLSRGREGRDEPFGDAGRKTSGV